MTSQQKAYLYGLFYTPQGQRSFPLQVLIEASSVIKKLIKGAEELKEKGKIVGIQFSEELIEFTEEEKKFIKQLLSEVKEATPSEYEIYTGLKQLFNA